MPRARLFRLAGAIMLIVAFVLPCIAFMGAAGDLLPDQDPTPEMLKEQAAADFRFGVAVAVSCALIAGGLIAFIYAYKQGQPGKVRNNT
ncbi:hypothetical protein [Actinoplanes regularis]|uniref:hypothetical protein n=1 Tax=Actinoplanes regularis TaxID=52697 RepID=UPI0024A4942D|nr:hypothetical protein [Actinoplanes regularis]GLW34926.1 hypothetical protein Areg01_78620 [Actinoplanes regularis]